MVSLSSVMGNYHGIKHVLNGPDGLTIEIPLKDFEGNQPFIQAVRGQNSGESNTESAAFN
ncbi:hypothetical protein COO20_14600 [Thalassospira marina]|uniref:Uncharacterized protein n=1 Tax=Thalassospira marina TaxID=2048283 RepID=A0A2N3KRY9_9PROT|nr:hypothetical protein COO20_14600 [Thalassospira marina]